MSRHYRDVRILLVSADDFYDLIASVRTSDDEMVIDVAGQHEVGPYLIRGRRVGAFFAGVDEINDNTPIDLVARWCQLGDVWVGYWRESGQEYLFSFRLPRTPVSGDDSVLDTESPADTPIAEKSALSKPPSFEVARASGEKDRRPRVDRPLVRRPQAPKRDTASESFDELGLKPWLGDPRRFRTGYERTDDPALREQFHGKFVKMQARSDFAQVVDILRQYVQECIPAPPLTERDYWCVTAMPSSGHRISVINMHWMEVLVLLYSPDEGDVGYGFINVDGDILKRAYKTEGGLKKQHPLAWYEQPVYKKSAGKAGINTVAIFADTIEALRMLLDDPVVLDAARHLNWAVMHLGRNIYARFHCYDLADLLV